MEPIKRLSLILDNGNATSVIYVPMISMRSYETNLYDLTCDGNVNRFSSVFLNVIKDFEKRHKDGIEIFIVLPLLEECTPESEEFIKRLVKESEDHISVLHTSMFPSGGPKQERSLKPIAKLADYVRQMAALYKCSTIIYEANYLGVLLEGHKIAFDRPWKTIYWCPVSETMTFQPDFLKSVAYVDQELVKCCDYMLVAVEAQKRHFERFVDDKDKVILMPMLIDPSLPMFSFKRDTETLHKIQKMREENNCAIIYFPFRLTDKGYRFEDVANAIVNLALNWNICLVYSNPNDSDLIEEVEDLFAEYEDESGIPIWTMKIPKDRDTYYTMISESGCIVPYFEDVSEVMHASWQEMEYFRTTKCVKDPYAIIDQVSIETALETALNVTARYAIASR